MAHDWKGLIIGSVVSAVIFLIIYSLWLNPTIITSTYDQIKSSVGTNVKSQVEQDPSVSNCLNQINKKLNIIEEKSPIKVNIYVKEYKKFSTKSEAESYMKEWGFSDYSLYHEDLGYMGPANWMDYSRSNIIIALVKQEASVEGQSVSQLSPYLCVDGDFKFETRCPNGAMTDIQLLKNVPPGRIFDKANYANFSYTVKSSSNNLYNYSLVLKDNSGNVVDSSFGDNPSGGTVSVDIAKIEGNEFETTFTFSNSCGTYTE